MTPRSALCKSCHAAPPERDRSRCAPCAAKRRAAEAVQRDERRRKRLCLTCGTRGAKGRRYCAEHLEYYAERDAARRASCS